MSLKERNEITVKIKCELETFYKTVEEKGFKIVDKFSMNDVYFIPNTLEIDKIHEYPLLLQVVKNVLKENKFPIHKINYDKD